MPKSAIREVGGPLRTTVVRQPSRNTCRLQFRQVVKELSAFASVGLAYSRLHDIRGTDQLAGWPSLALVCCGTRNICFRAADFKSAASLFFRTFQSRLARHLEALPFLFPTANRLTHRMANGVARQVRRISEECVICGTEAARTSPETASLLRQTPGPGLSAFPEHQRSLSPSHPPIPD